MARIRSLTVGFVGKLGNVIGYYNRGKYYVREYVPEVKYTDTEKQKIVRSKFSWLAKFVSAVYPAVKIGFYKQHPGYAFAQAMKYNFDAVTSDGEKTRPEYPILLVSKGKLPEPWFDRSATFEPNAVSVGYLPNDNLNGASGDDEVYVLVYNEDLGMAALGEPTPRSGRIAICGIPDDWNGCWGVVYGFAINSKGKACNSVYLGEGTLTSSGGTYYSVILSVDPAGFGTVIGSGRYLEGTPVTLIATPANGCKFVQWSDGVTDNPREERVDRTIELTAQFDYDTPTTSYRLALASSPAEGGTTTGAGVFPAHELVPISATAAENYRFDHWSDGNQNASRYVEMTGNIELTAYFVSTTTYYTLNLIADPYEGGTVTGDGEYAAGTRVTINAIAANGYHFTQWSDGVTTAQRVVTLNSNMTLRAYFAKDVARYTVLLYAEPSAGGTVDGGGYYEYGTEITIRAIAAANYVFRTWSDNVKEADRTFRVMRDLTLTAYFDRAEYTITVVASPAGGGRVLGGGSYTYGSQVVIEAVADTGYVFSRWSDGNTAARRTINVVGSATYTAEFVTATYYTITPYATPAEGGTVSGGGSFPVGTYTILVAVAAAHYKFDYWSYANGTIVSYDASYRMTGTGNMRRYAHFSRTEYKVTIDMQPDLTVGTVEGGGWGEASREMKAVPKEGYRFMHWECVEPVFDGVTESRDNPVHMVYDGDVTVKVIFEAE